MLGVVRAKGTGEEGSQGSSAEEKSRGYIMIGHLKRGQVTLIIGIYCGTECNRHINKITNSLTQPRFFTRLLQ